MPGFWLSLTLHLQHISHTVHIDGTLPFLTLKLCLHILLQTCFTNQVVGVIIFILFFQRIQLILVRLANISNDICKIFRIGIRTQTAQYPLPADYSGFPGSLQLWHLIHLKPRWWSHNV